MPTPRVKICRKCKKEKDASLFYKNILLKSGLDSYCKECSKWYQQVSYSKIKAREKRRRHIRAFNAKARVRTALKSGRIMRKPCLFCAEKKVDGHHLLYDFPLVVIWLCKKHHMEVHKEKSYAKP